MISRPFFTPRKTRMRMNLHLVASGDFVLGRDVLCEFDYWPLAVSMPPTKVYPQCKAAVPVRRCDHVFRSKRKAECNTQVQSHALLRRGFGTSVPFIQNVWIPYWLLFLQTLTFLTARYVRCMGIWPPSPLQFKFLHNKFSISIISKGIQMLLVALL